jgi:hypothetical protein
VAGRERLRNAAIGGTQLSPVVSFLVLRAAVAGGPQLSSIRSMDKECPVLREIPK